MYFGAISQNKIFFHFLLEWWCSHSTAAHAGIWETKHIRRFENTLFTILFLHTFQRGGLGGGGQKSVNGIIPGTRVLFHFEEGGGGG